ncbi:MAG: replication-associated recombination protein A [Candidatus Dojkabacteria bacterium]|nr:MAG: replication-associated recombination protein A [Candidatus Dojkabacteria bacterium]
MSEPLAEKLRPKNLDGYIGQEHLLGEGKPLRLLLDNHKLVSMILWGPPGSGKTTLARLCADYAKAEFVCISAVTSGIPDLKIIIARAKERALYHNSETILFIDEIHRFNKAQQDALLPHVEDGTLILIGATTENPGFEVNAPLVSRMRVYRLHPLSDNDIRLVINRAAEQFPLLQFDKEAINFIVKFANGDARSAINAVEISASLAKKKIDLSVIEDALQSKSVRYDKGGDEHYDTISAFIKSMRGGNPHATLHYLARMLKAGEDPKFIARRMIIFASEDIGNAKPNALVLATTCMQAVSMIGMPESQLILAQTATYLATSPKSIASTEGIFKALADLENERIEPIPLHLRNESNKLMKQFGYGKGHIRYPWLEEKKGRKVKQEYLPKNLAGRRYYIEDWD